MSYLVGDGSSIYLARDKWLDLLTPARTVPLDASPSQEQTAPVVVGDLMMPDSRSWDMGKINLWFDEESAKSILHSRVLVEPNGEKLIWFPARNICFSVKSAWWMVANSRYNPERQIWKRIWKLLFQERLKFMLWYVASEVIKVKRKSVGGCSSSG